MKRIALFILLISSLVIAGCGAIPQLSRAVGSDQSVSDMALREETMEMEAPSAGEAEPQEAPRSSDLDMASVQERLVIRNANLSVVVEDPDESVEAISRMAESMGGFVVSSNVFQTSFGDARLGEPIQAKQANITIRVPSDQLDQALDQIKEGAVEVRNQNISGQDVTEEYTDLQARLRNLQAAEEQLREIMQSSTETEDTLRVLQELRQVREEIEVIQGRIQYLEQSTRLSSISVDLIPDVAAQPLQIGRWTPEGTAREAVEALVGALQFLGDAAIWGVICVVPVALIVGLPLYLAGRAIWHRRKRAQVSKESKQGGKAHSA
ncbi:MAG: DUF4349 domain-containing protein [Anaerolineales bacterium]